MMLKRELEQENLKLFATTEIQRGCIDELSKSIKGINAISDGYLKLIDISEMVDPSLVRRMLLEIQKRSILLDS